MYDLCIGDLCLQSWCLCQQGTSGIIRDPMLDLNEKGFSGFCKGVGRGLLGVVVKPVSGLVDGVAHTVEDVAHIASGHALSLIHI